MRNVAFHDILYLWLYNRLVDRELSKNFLVDPSQRQVGHPCPREFLKYLEFFAVTSEPETL